MPSSSGEASSEGDGSTAAGGERHTGTMVACATVAGKYQLRETEKRLKRRQSVSGGEGHGTWAGV